jgi:hypothetical protein
MAPIEGGGYASVEQAGSSQGPTVLRHSGFVLVAGAPGQICE